MTSKTLLTHLYYLLTSEFFSCSPFSLLTLVKVPSHMIIDHSELTVSEIGMASPLKYICGVIL